MASKLKRRGRRSTGTPSEMSNEQGRPIFIDCKIQIGKGNVMSIEEAKEELQHPTGSRTNDICVGLLKKLFIKAEHDDIQPIPINDLRKKFEKEFGMLMQGKSRFTDIVGLPIDQFVNNNSTEFRTYHKNKKIIVALLKHQEYDSTSDDEKYSDALTELPQPDTGYHSSPTCFETGNDDIDPLLCGHTTTYAAIVDSHPEANKCDNPERKLKEKKGMEHFKTSEPTNNQSEGECSNELQGPSMPTKDERLSSEEILFQSLIAKQQNVDLKFCPSVETYLDDPNEFMIDMASMWNTPYKYNAHIILGVRATETIPHELIGINHVIDKEILEELFSLKCFTGIRPVFSYHKVNYRRKDFGIIEIQSSYGRGQPCVLSFPSKEETSGDLWARERNERRICGLNDSMTNRIFQWFIGNQHMSEAITAKSSSPTPQTKSVHTSTCEKVSSGTDTVLTLEELPPVFHKFKSGHYVLLAGDTPKGMSNAEAISLVPWVAVHDFDIRSRDHGLLNSNEEWMEKRRSLQLTSWNSSAASLTENSTVWNFPLGRRDDPTSRVANEKNVKTWFNQTKRGIDNTIEQLSRFANGYTVLTVVIFWPEDENIAPFMYKFLERLDDKLDPSPRIVLCLPKEPLLETGKNVLGMLRDYHKDNLTTIKMELTKICVGIAQILQDEEPAKGDVQYDLQIYSDSGNETCCITEKEVAWLQKHLEVLYLTSPYSKTMVEELKSEGENFYRGGSLHWFAWYECGPNFFDVERGQMSGILSKINNVLKEDRFGLFTLYHAPGSGGTTLGQRILWEFHKKTPCVHVKIKSSVYSAEVVERIEMIYEKTRSPVLLLIDGEDEMKVKNLFRMIRSRYTAAVILYVKRYVKRITVQETNFRQSWLEGAVTISEAKKLTLKFGERCKNDDTKITNLNRLCKDVEEKTPHYMYEFGLATYLHEFKGITSYVKGYLNLEENETNDLTVSQVILGYLSLVYIYGQTSLSCQFFSSLLHIPSNRTITLTDFPEPIDAFVVPDDIDGRTRNIRICHYLIAKEILEQLLSRQSSLPLERAKDLSQEARENLAAFCRDFIEYCGRKKVNTCKSPYSVVHVLTKTFIYRDNKDVSENAEQVRRKPVLSKVMIDIPSKQPLFRERISVLHKLTEAFPDDPNFHAHLGRFYAYYRPDEVDEIEKCFQISLRLCEEGLQGKDINDIDERFKMSVTHVYHMYGTILQKRIASYTGQAPTELPQKETEEEHFIEILEDLITKAKTACLYFNMCRKYTPPGQENCLGYIGEISVRLQICDYVHKHFKDDSFEGISGFISPALQKSIPGRRFVKNSISIIDSLFMECYKFVEHEDMDHSMQKALFWYHTLFRDKSSDLEAIVTGDDVFAHRLKIAARKLKHGSKMTSLHLLEDVASPNDINDIVAMYEKIFHEISRTGIEGSKRALEMDYLEWLYAIRHRHFAKNYKLEEVLSWIRQWNEKLNSPMAKFYLFVITSLLGFGDDNKDGRTEYMSEAQILKDETRRMGKLVLKPKYPREWLGIDGKGIKRLISGTRFLGLNADERDMKTMHLGLLLCRGTICPPNDKKLSGYISLDLRHNTVPIKVFFKPNVANLATTQYVHERVEFVLAFSLDHGYDAFDVKLLKKYACSNQSCSSRVEITSEEDCAWCPSCDSMVEKDDSTT